MSIRRLRCRGGLTLAVALIAVASVASCDSSGSRTSRAGTTRPDELANALAPAATVTPRNGIAAAILIDVSTSMGQTPAGAGELKIVSARRAAVDLVKQFARYADAHPEEPVLLGIYEFSVRKGQPDSREVIPMGPPAPERAGAAVARMIPRGNTPIGEAMIAGKRALDATGLSRRHLLVITDGDNTTSYPPDAVAVAIGERPAAERPSIYFVAFDVSARRFTPVRNAGAFVLEAADSRALSQTLDALLRGEILLER